MKRGRKDTARRDEGQESKNNENDLDETRLFFVQAVHGSLWELCGGSGSSRSSHQTTTHSSSNLVETEEAWKQVLHDLAEATVTKCPGGEKTPWEWQIRTAPAYFHRYKEKMTKRSSESNDTDVDSDNTDAKGSSGGSDKKKKKTGGSEQLMIVSNLGLERHVSTPYQFGQLLLVTLEQHVQEAYNDSGQWLRQQNQQQQPSSSWDIRCDLAGFLCITSISRMHDLRQMGRLVCPQCPGVNWCKGGEQGLWWHLQTQHYHGGGGGGGGSSSSSTDNENLNTVTVHHQQNHGHATAAAMSLSKQNEQALVVYNRYHHSHPEDSLESKEKSVTSCTKQAVSQRSKSLKSQLFDLVKAGDLLGLRRCLQEKDSAGYENAGGKNPSETPNPSTLVDDNGASLLLWAAGGGYLDLVQYLIETVGCDPHFAQASQQTRRGGRAFQGRTALHWAARKGHLIVVKYLVEKWNVDLEAKTRDGTTAFCWAAWQGHTNILKYLHGRGCSSQSANMFGCNAALWASQGAGDSFLLAWLESIGCSWKTAINHNGHSVLHKAAQRGRRDLVEWFIHELRFDIFPCPHILELIGPDSDQCIPSDLARMEGHDQLAMTLHLEEMSIIQDAMRNNVLLPAWLSPAANPMPRLGAEYEMGLARLRLATNHVSG